MIQNLLNTVADQSLRSLAAFPGNRQAKAQPGSEAAGLWFAEKAWLFSRKKQSLIGRSSKLQVTRFCTKVIPARGTGGSSRREVQAAAQAADGSEKSEKSARRTACFLLKSCSGRPEGVLFDSFTALACLAKLASTSFPGRLAGRSGGEGKTKNPKSRIRSTLCLILRFWRVNPVTDWSARVRRRHT